MKLTSVQEAKPHLSRLLEQVERGEEVIIARAGKPVAKLVPYGPDDQAPRQGGQWRGRVRIAADFDKLPADHTAALGMAAPE